MHVADFCKSVGEIAEHRLHYEIIREELSFVRMSGEHESRSDRIRILHPERFVVQEYKWLFLIESLDSSCGFNRAKFLGRSFSLKERYTDNLQTIHGYHLIVEYSSLCFPYSLKRPAGSKVDLMIPVDVKDPLW